MTLHTPNKKNNRNNNHGFHIFFVAIIWILGVFVFGNFFKTLTTKALAVTHPVQQKTNVVTQFLADFWNFSKMRADYYRLKEQEQMFSKNNGAISILKFENEKLHKILNSESHKFNIVPAKVLLGDLTGVDGVFIIDRGTNDGLRKGMNVILPDNVLVGKIIEIAPTYSKVMSIYNSSISLSVINLDKDFLSLMQKDGSGSLVLKFYPDGSTFESKDVFITSNENKDFIQGLLVGKVKSIKDTKSTNQKNVTIEPFFELPRVQNVFVITNYP